ncbi:MAG: HAMP domain-containing protein [Gemmatimonadaceae bacterium]|nr:HAMP domain-containing protein [Gemmatimonadaceae bacterium]
MVAANRVPTRRRTNTRPGAHIAPTPPVDPDTVALSPPVRELLRLKPLGNETLLRSLTIDDQIWRAALVRVGPGIVDSLEPALIVGVLRSDEEDVAVLDRVRTTLLLAIPFALAVTILAGYLLARRSLAPVEEMAASAARISAATLDERLPVSNPYDELGRLATVVNDLLARVDVAFRVQRQFVADASHELRTPIAIVRGEADVALQMPTRAEAEYRDALAIIRDESVRLSRIIDDLFLLARADAASPIHQRERVDIGELLAASVRSVRTIADDQHMRLTLEHAGDNRDAVFVDGDPVLLRRLLLNLLDNALKHTPRDGAISVAFRNTASHVVIVVADSGPGIPPELRPRIFDRFVRGAVDAGEGLSSGTSRVPTASGAGLGLAIAQAIAHAHGGQIVLDNTTTGAAFRVTLLRD